MTDDYRRESRDRFGANLRRLREAAGFSQEGLARKAGISTSHVVKIEAGKTAAGFDKINALAAALGVSISVMFDGIDPDAGDLADIRWYPFSAPDLPFPSSGTESIGEDRARVAR